MTSAASQNSQTAVGGESHETVPNRAVLILLAGMAAAWFAAGSTGLLGHSLRHALSWIALGTAIAAAWPEEKRDYRAWALLALGTILGIAFTAASSTAVNVLAVAVVMAAISRACNGHAARLALIGAMAATVLGCFRFACDSIPIVWQTADRIGWAMGKLAETISGKPLEIGATFAGLDFIVLTTVVYLGWLHYTPPPRRRRAIFGAAAIFAGQIIYLIVLAKAEQLLALLPETVVPFDEDNNYVGLWSLSNTLRAMIPWNLPLVAAVIQGVIVSVMICSTRWLPADGPDSPEHKRRQEEQDTKELPGSALAADMLLRFGPVLLAVAAVLSATLTTDYANLEGETIVAYANGNASYWEKLTYDSDAGGNFSLYPAFVESLGGKFIVSENLSEEDISKADVLWLVKSEQPWSADKQERILDYVRNGGTLLATVYAMAGGSQAFDDMLKPLSIRVRTDVSVPRVLGWDQSYMDSSHPAAIGLNNSRNNYGMVGGSSIDAGWLAEPLLIGRWGWTEMGWGAELNGTSSHNVGERLGDLPLAAEQSYGDGRVVLLSEIVPLLDEQLPSSHQFVGRLLEYLANRQSSPCSWWRQSLAIAALAAMLVLLACRLEAWQLIVTPSVLAVTLLCTVTLANQSGRILPDGRNRPVNNIAYIDASHLESYVTDSWSDYGITGLIYTLERQGYVPLFAPDLQPDRLERCGLLISIGPLKKFSPDERKAIDRFVTSGGTMICLVGAEEARASAPLLADFGIQVPPTPVPPGEDSVEPVPFGGGISGRTQDGESIGFFHAAWPVKSLDDNVEPLVYWTEDGNAFDLVVRQSKGSGSFVVIGDTHNAATAVGELNAQAVEDFWRWLLGRTVAGQKKWNPPTEQDGEKQNDSGLREKGIDDNVGG